MKPTNKQWLIIQMFLLWTGISFQAMASQPGESAAALELPLLSDGQLVSLSDFKGKIVYVDFWASWCGPCRRSLPLYEALYQRLDSDRFQILAVNLDEDKRDAERFLNRHPVSYPVLLDPDGNSAKAWSVLAMPSSYLIDSEGRLAYIYIGFEVSHMEKIEHDINTLLDAMQNHLPGTDAVGTDGLR